MPGTRTFLRDVGINVLANLIAGAIIYVGGVFLGFFPKNTHALATALALLLASACFLILMAARLVGGRAQLIGAAIGALFLACALIVAGVGGGRVGTFDPTAIWQRGALVLVGALFLFPPGWLVFEFLDTRRRRRRSERRSARRHSLAQPQMRMTRRRPNRTGRR